MEYGYGYYLMDALWAADKLFELTASRTYRLATKKSWAKVPNREWVSTQVADFADTVGGRELSWRTPADDSGRPACAGGVNFLPVEEIYADWEGSVYFGFPEENPRLRQFKPVDYCQPEAFVGLYHDEAKSPALYYYAPGEGQEPYPLQLDLEGYVQLLPYTLGYEHWQLALLELLPDDDRNPAHRLESVTPALRRDLNAWYPDFDYDAFVARYQEVRMR